MQTQPLAKSSRPGISDFVPAENSRFLKAVEYHSGIRKLFLLLKSSRFESLLDPNRLLALTELVTHATKHVAGDVIELGVYKGGSAAAVAWALQRARLVRQLHLCDTFEGMPHTLEWEFHKKGDFSDTSFEVVSKRLAGLAPGYPFRFHRGLFSETLPALSNAEFCFAHVDADLYRSVRDACEFVYPRMQKGGIILFDDYGASTCAGTKKAVDEFFADKPEKPTHVSMTAYAVCVGEEKMDFKELLLKRTRFAAMWRAPGRALRQRIKGHCGQIASPKITRILTGPFIYGRVKVPEYSIAVQDAQSVLVLRLDRIGDLVLTTPFLRELRKSNRNAWITLVVDPAALNLVELCPYVNEVLPFRAPEEGETTGNLRQNLHALRMARGKLWKRRFDLALLPRWDTDIYSSNFLAYFSRARCRLGYSEHVNATRHRANRGYDQLLTRVVDERGIKHEVERNLDLLRHVGGTVADDRLELWLADEDRETATAALASCGLNSAPLLVALAPGASDPKRIWPLARFVEVGRFLHREYGARLLVIGGPDVREPALRIQTELRGAAFSFAGELTLRQTAAMLEHTDLVISNDSGPMHIAAAAGAAVIEISCHPASGDPSHVNSPARLRPWAIAYQVLQPAAAVLPCTSSCDWHEAHCIQGVSVEAVQHAVASACSKSRCLRADR